MYHDLSVFWNGILSWMKDAGLGVILIVIGSILAARSVHFIATKISAFLGSKAKLEIRDDFMLSERNKHVSAVVQALDWAAVAVVYSVSFVVILIRLNVPIASLAAPAAIFGAALGFGAQRVVQDLLAGFFIFAERQFGIGDIIKISQPGTLVGIGGTVEEVTLRSTRIRTLAGEQVTVSNSDIRQVVNSSREWSQVVVDFPIKQEADLIAVKNALSEMATTVSEDVLWASYFVGPTVVTGVEVISIGVVTMRVLARTLPAQQWEVAREIRIRGLGVLSTMDVLFRANSINLNYGPQL